MAPHHLLPIIAFIASVLLMLTPSARLPGALAAAASGLELLMAWGVVHLSFSKFSVSLVLGLVLLVAGVFCWLRVGGKMAISAATVTVLVGLSQVVRGF